MPLLAIPNVSEGRDLAFVRALEETVTRDGCRVLDVHTDPAHNRSVLTLTGNGDHIILAMTDLARAASAIDLTVQRGVHPRIGGLDVCPVVPHNTHIGAAVGVARAIGEAIGDAVHLPVFFYGEAATRAELQDLPAIRKGGLPGLIGRVKSGLRPDAGPAEIDERRGVVCVGARRPLIAFNVWLRAEPSVAKSVAAAVRTSTGGPVGIRALGLGIDDAPTSQVSMNLTEPSVTGIDLAFSVVEAAARRVGASIIATEIVGLVPEINLPDPDAKAARLLLVPGRSVESALRR
jgi:glutamate formiminotransferase / 5-formyltetrahydrofolate cyclo-ligase